MVVILVVRFQTCSLAGFLMDPYYRTIEGFIVLVPFFTHIYFFSFYRTHFKVYLKARVLFLMPCCHCRSKKSGWGLDTSLGSALARSTRMPRKCRLFFCSFSRRPGKFCSSFRALLSTMSSFLSHFTTASSHRRFLVV